MIKNITTDVTYGTLALAIAGLPATLNQNYTIEVTGETAGIAGFTYSGNCSTFKLTIQTPDTSVIDGAGATAITFGGTTKHNISLTPLFSGIANWKIPAISLPGRSPQNQRRRYQPPLSARTRVLTLKRSLLKPQKQVGKLVL